MKKSDASLYKQEIKSGNADETLADALFAAVVTNAVTSSGGNDPTSKVGDVDEDSIKAEEDAKETLAGAMLFREESDDNNKQYFGGCGEDDEVSESDKTSVETIVVHMSSD